MSTAKLDALPGFVIPTKISDWTPANIAGMRMFTDRDGVQTYLDVDDYKQAMSLPNLPLVTVPGDPYSAYKPWLLRYPQGNRYLVIYMNGNIPVAENFTAATGTYVGQNPPETFVQPGTGTPTLTMEILGGADFANFLLEYGGHFENGIPKFATFQRLDDFLITTNFSKGLGYLAPLPLGWDTLGPSYGFDRRYVPYITDSQSVRLVHRDDVKRLGKTNQPAPVVVAAPVYRNDGLATANVITALQAAGITGTELGNAVNAAARMTK